MQIAGRLGVVALVIGVFGACSSGTRRSGGSSTTSRSIASSQVSSTTRARIASKAPSARWTTYDGDVERTGLATDGPLPARGVREQWTSPTLDGDVYAQPLVVGDRVIIATENDT